MRDGRLRRFLHKTQVVLFKKRTIMIVFCSLLCSTVMAVTYFLSWIIPSVARATMIIIHESYEYETEVIQKSSVNSIIVNQHLFTFPINPLHACAPDGKEVAVLVTVCSAPWNFEARQALRSTWLSHIAMRPLNASVVFVLGTVNSPNTQDYIDRESRMHQDIIQSDFVDSYRNLSLKTTAMLKWVKNFCPNVQYVVKTDDDTFVNLEKLVAMLDTINMPRIILGHVIVGDTPRRDNASKWYVTHEDYPGIYYPKFCSGSGYVLSGDLIGDLYTATLYTKMFFLEDVYITGICARHIRATHLHSWRFKYDTAPTDCILAEVVTGHYLSPSDLHTYWYALQSLKMQICVIFPSVPKYVPIAIILSAVIVCWIYNLSLAWTQGKVRQSTHM